MDDALERIHYALYVKLREHMGREASSTACVIDSRSVKSAEKRGRIDPNGYDAGKKRYILIDTVGLLLNTVVHPADIQDCDGGMLVISMLLGMFLFLKVLFADSGYQGPQFQAALTKVLP